MCLTLEQVKFKRFIQTDEGFRALRRHVGKALPTFDRQALEPFHAFIDKDNNRCLSISFYDHTREHELFAKWVQAHNVADMLEFHPNEHYVRGPFSSDIDRLYLHRPNVFIMRFPNQRKKLI